MNKARIFSILSILYLLCVENCDSRIFVCRYDVFRKTYSRVYESGFDCNGQDGGQCVALVKCLCGAPYTGNWEPGVNVGEICQYYGQWNWPRIGTVIATFENNRYIGDGSGHAAIFMGCTWNGDIRVYDQWCGRTPQRRTISTRSRHHNKMHVVECNTGCDMSSACNIVYGVETRIA